VRTGPGAVGAAAPARPPRSALVGVDESLSARLALEEAAARVGPDGRLVLVHSIVPPPGEPFSRPLTELAVDRRALADALVDRLAASVDVRTVETAVLGGWPPGRLSERARAEDVDAVVVGSRGLGRFVAALGSVSHALLHEADRPVVVVPRAAADRAGRRRPAGGRTVVVGHDGSPAARAALAFAAADAGPDGLVVAVHAYAPVPDWLGAPNYDEVLIAHQRRGRALLDDLAAHAAPGVRLETSLLEGAPARALLAAAEARDADEVVVGSRGFSPLRGALGSVSHALLHEADRPVVVIPERAVAG